MGKAVQDPALDLRLNSKAVDFIVDPKELGRPLDLAAIFGREAPLEVEIGFGYGHFLVRRAKEAPERNFLGFELSSECIRKTISKIEKAGIANVRLVRMDARLGFYFLPERSVSVTYMNFPDPWPRKKHKKRRLLDGKFLELLASRTVDGGEFYFVTDHDDYLEYALELFRESPYWKWEGEEFTLEMPDYFDTKYRRKWERMGKRIYFLRRIKAVHPVGIRELVEEVKEMPHVVLEREGIDVKRLGELVGPEIRFDGGVIRYFDVFENQRGDRILLETLVSEGGISQRFFILVELSGREVTVKLARRAEVAVTTGVKRAIKLVAEKLGGKILRANIGN